MIIQEVLEHAAKLVEPTEEERKRAKVAERVLRERLDEIGVEYVFVGSYARDTWLKNSLEIDVFILFSPDVSREELEKRGIEIGKAVLDECEIRYAEHPYVHGRVEGVEADIVPCYKVESAEKIKSAVDRTPFHHMWLRDRIKGKERDVRILKGFLKANDLYGAEYKVRGFSGYLCELLIIHYSSFRKLVEEARTWTRRTVIDVARGEIRKGESFFVVDPVDEKRNVAANLSIDNLARFVHLCRQFVESPGIEFFSGLERRKFDLPHHIAVREAEKRAVLCIKFDKPDIVEDNLYPQLERACRKIREFLEREGFSPLRHAHAAGIKCYLFFECGVAELSPIVRRIGPPFEEEEHVRRFLKKWMDSKHPYKPFIEDGRWWVYDCRECTKPEDAVAGFVKEQWRSLGKNVGVAIRDTFQILSGRDIVDQIAGEKMEVKKKFAEFLCIPDERMR